MESTYPRGESFLFTFFSDIIGREVVDSTGNIVGKVFDILAVTSEVYPRAVELIINEGVINRRYAHVAWSMLADINQGVRLKVIGSSLKFSRLKEPKTEISLRRDILDHQVVDTFNQRVVRVNDLHLLKVGMELMVAHIDIGMRGLLRRLGFGGFVDFFISLINSNANYLKKEDFIPWKNVQVLSVNPAMHSLKVAVPIHQFSKIHPVELSEVLMDLDPDARSAFFKALDLKTQAKVFDDIDVETQKFLIQGMNIDEIAQLVAILPTDEAADFLDEIPKEMVQRLLGMIETSQAKKLSTLLGYRSDSAGGLMTIEYISVPGTMLVKDVLVKVKESNLRSETISHVYVVDEKNHLLGNTTLKRMLAANPDDTILAMCNLKPITVHLNDSVKEVAFKIEKYRLFALPVIDGERVLHGIITVDDILEQLLALVWRRQPKL